jgi:hypothetical protein
MIGQRPTAEDVKAELGSNGTDRKPGTGTVLDRPAVG